jgi:hypothetical protein
MVRCELAAAALSGTKEGSGRAGERVGGVVAPVGPCAALKWRGGGRARAVWPLRYATFSHHPVTAESHVRSTPNLASRATCGDLPTGCRPLTLSVPCGLRELLLASARYRACSALRRASY